jgi:hypothetical protein
MQKKPTTHSGTFGFANTKATAEKPKEPEFLPTLKLIGQDLSIKIKIIKFGHNLSNNENGYRN